MSIRKVRELPVGAKRAVEQLLGRTLRKDEEVSVMAFPPHPAPVRKERKALARRLAKVLDKAANKAKGIPRQQLEAAIQEATRNVRNRHP